MLSKCMSQNGEAQQNCVSLGCRPEQRLRKKICQCCIVRNYNSVFYLEQMQQNYPLNLSGAFSIVETFLQDMSLSDTRPTLQGAETNSSWLLSLPGWAR